jgi:hypothetical protein
MPPSKVTPGEVAVTFALEENNIDCRRAVDDQSVYRHAFCASDARG